MLRSTVDGRLWRADVQRHWTFDPNANLNNAAGISAGFTYQITDGDGDTSTAAQVITINDGAVAATPAPVTLDLNEAALSTAGATGSNPSLTSEVDNTPALSFTAGSDNLTSFAFSGIGGLVTDLNGTGGQDIFWQLVSPTQIKGFLDAGHTLLAVTLDLSAPASIAAGATGNVTVTATLSDNLQHVLANGAQISSIGNVGVVATDTDGDTTTGTVNINVQDDVPTANAGPALTVIETDGVTSGTNLLANDVQGADGATVTAVDLGGGFQAIAASGNDDAFDRQRDLCVPGERHVDVRSEREPEQCLRHQRGLHLPDHGRRRRPLDGGAGDHDQRRRGCGDACAGDAGPQ